MIFAGDVAIANKDIIRFTNFPDDLKGKFWCFNLEGAVSITKFDPPSRGVYNTADCLDQLKEFNLAPFFIGNNHIHDVNNGVVETANFLKLNGLEAFGAGENLEEAARVRTFSSGVDYSLLGYGWDVIGCRAATKRAAGVNPFCPDYIKDSVLKSLNLYPNSRIAVVIHGNYEFEKFLQPGHRKLSRELIDIGAFAVIFHHSHIVGPIEVYKGRIIAHGLGNWAFSYGKHFGGKLRFPSSSFHQIAIEMTEESCYVHHSCFEPPCEVKFVYSEEILNPNFSLRPIFQDFNDEDYLNWFKKNRHKRIMLPIYRSSTRSIFDRFRNYWVLLRQNLIKVFVRLNLKSHARKSN